MYFYARISIVIWYHDQSRSIESKKGDSAIFDSDFIKYLLLIKGEKGVVYVLAPGVK